MADREHQPWTRIAIRNNDRFSLTGETDEVEFDLELDYKMPAAEFQVSQEEKVKYRGLFMTNASIDFSQLSLTLNPDGGPTIESYDTKESIAVHLSYERVESTDP